MTLRPLCHALPLLPVAAILAAAPATAAMDGHTALERGGALDLAAQEEWQAPWPVGPARELRLRLSLRPDLSAGTLAAPPPGLGFEAATALELGGFVTWHLDEFALTGAARAGAESGGADLAASYRPEAVFDGATAFRIGLGADWTSDAGSISLLGPMQLSPAQGGASATDYSLSFSVRHNLWPGVYVGGIAAAERRDQPDAASGRDDGHVLFGAGLGLRF